MVKCEYYEDGYCTYEKSVEEQLESETQWECSGSEEEMHDCGMMISPKHQENTADTNSDGNNAESGEKL